MNIEFKKASPIIQILEKAGYEAYFVGGSVRDVLLHRKIGDIDIATSATPQEVKSLFKKTIDVGIEHGTVIVLWKGDSFEVTTFRTEGAYEDFRRPNTVQFVRTLKDDLRRRDFTMNAIAMDLDGTIHDPFLGSIALQKKVIATVGNADERFNEDALRLMRALRFVSQLNFSLEENTLLAVIRNASLIQHISIERISIEFEKLLQGLNRGKAIDLLVKTDLYQYLPGLSNKDTCLREFAALPIGELSIEEMWCLLCYICKIDQLESFLRNWKLPVKQIKKIRKTLTWLSFRLEHRWSMEAIYYATSDCAISVEKIFSVINQKQSNKEIDTINELKKKLPIIDRRELSINGSDLIHLKGLPGGPWVQELLLSIEKAVINNKVENRKESIIQWLNQHNLM